MTLQAIVSVILIPRIGVTGAALAMCIGFAAQGVIRFAEVRHVFGWSWPWHTLARPLAAFAIATARPSRCAWPAVSGPRWRGA